MSRFALFLDRPAGPQRHLLREGRSLVGRGQDCDIVVDDGSVSRQHAALVVANDQIEVADLDSTNGTFLNALTIKQARVAPGDSLTFGSVAAVVELADEQTAILERAVLRRPADLNVAAGSAAVVDASRLIKLLGEIAQTLIATLTLPQVLTRVLDLLFAHIRAERACLLVHDAEGDTLHPVLARQSDGRTTEHPAISRTVLDLALVERLAIVTFDAHVDRRFDGAHSLIRGEVRSIMCAPLYSDGDPIGALYADNIAASQFSEADLELFTALANYAAVAIARARLVDQLLEERRQRERLQRYHSPAVVDRIVARQAPEHLLTAQELDVSVLFADIVQFTTLAESMRPADVAELLNTFFSRMVEAIFAEDGTVDKFVGDAILAVFGAPVEQSDHACRAVRAAHLMRRIVAELNAEAAFPHLRVRYAINSGLAIAGDIGSTRRREYTVLGDVVNVAARMQEIAEPDQLVLSRATYDRLEHPLSATSLGEFSVRGRTGRLEVLALDL